MGKLHGNKCATCNGTGILPDPEHVWNDRDKKKKSKCPYGHRYGKDTDSFPDCNKCKKWDDCVDEKEN